MELTPRYQAERYRRQARDSVALAMKARGERSLALLIDTAIEMNRMAREARRRLGREDGR
jgi:hypothetical protein